MVVYNELVAVTAGAGLLGFAGFLADLIRNKRIDSEGWAGFFGVTGLLLLVLGLHTTVTWPFGGDGLRVRQHRLRPAGGRVSAPCCCSPPSTCGVTEPSSPATSDEANATACGPEAGSASSSAPSGSAMAVLAITLRPVPARRGSARGADQRPLRPPAHPRGAVPRRPVGRRRRRRPALRDRAVDRTGPTLLPLGRPGLGRRWRGVPALRRDELLHPHRDVLQHRRTAPCTSGDLPTWGVQALPAHSRGRATRSS